MRRWFKSLLVVLLSVLLLSGCAAENINMAYTVYPVGYLIDRVSGNSILKYSIQDDSVVQRAQINPDYEAILQQCGVFVHIGTLEPYITIYSENINASQIEQMDLSTLNAIYKFQRYTPVITDGVVSYIESPYYNNEVFADVDINEKELNLWLDPIAMLSMAKDIRNWLSENDPDKSEMYQDNWKNLEEELVTLDASYQAFATKVQNANASVKFVSMTASFGNWQKTYGIQAYPVILSKYGALPTDDQLAVIKARIVADNVKYIAYEPNMSEDMRSLYEELKNELGLQEVRLSNLSSLAEDEKAEGKDYISIMYENLRVLETMVDVGVSAHDELVLDEAVVEEVVEETVEEVKE
ncbi:MAG: zinc ABC transporter substrate-binding protein [Erysipelotrichaceae bacterium]|nr:zinc ABC transporter substrate-binding protein [Erysipelotrichaceae bacterium]